MKLAQGSAVRPVRRPKLRRIDYLVAMPLTLGALFGIPGFFIAAAAKSEVQEVGRYDIDGLQVVVATWENSLESGDRIGFAKTADSKVHWVWSEDSPLLQLSVCDGENPETVRIAVWSAKLASGSAERAPPNERLRFKPHLEIETVYTDVVPAGCTPVRL